MVIVSLYALCLCRINAVWDSMVLDWSLQPFLSMARARYAKRILCQSLRKQIEKEGKRKASEWNGDMAEREKKTAIHWKRKTAVMIHLHMLQMVMRHVNIALLSFNKSRVFIATSDSILRGNLWLGVRKAICKKQIKSDRECERKREKRNRSLHTSTEVHIRTWTKSF